MPKPVTPALAESDELRLLQCPRCQWPIAHTLTVQGRTVVPIGNVRLHAGEIECPKCHFVRHFVSQTRPPKRRARRGVASRSDLC